MRTIARIVLHPAIPNIRVSWVKMGRMVRWWLLGTEQTISVAY